MALFNEKRSSDVTVGVVLGAGASTLILHQHAVVRLRRLLGQLLSVSETIHCALSALIEDILQTIALGVESGSKFFRGIFFVPSISQLQEAPSSEELNLLFTSCDNADSQLWQVFPCGVTN